MKSVLKLFYTAIGIAYIEATDHTYEQARLHHAGYQVQFAIERGRIGNLFEVAIQYIMTMVG